MALDCFGNKKEIVEIYGRGIDIHGKAYICYYTKFTDNSKISHSMKEGEVVPTVEITQRWHQARLVPDTHKTNNFDDV